jgi:hypothetical protein
MMEEQEEAEAEEEAEVVAVAVTDATDSAVIRSILSCIFLAADSTPSCVILLCIPRVLSDTSKLGVVKFTAGNMDKGRRAWEREME